MRLSLLPSVAGTNLGLRYFLRVCRKSWSPSWTAGWVGWVLGWVPRPASCGEGEINHPINKTYLARARMHPHFALIARVLALSSNLILQVMLS